MCMVGDAKGCRCRASTRSVRRGAPGRDEARRAGSAAFGGPDETWRRPAGVLGLAQGVEADAAGLLRIGALRMARLSAAESRSVLTVSAPMGGLDLRTGEQLLAGVQQRRGPHRRQGSRRRPPWRRAAGRAPGPPFRLRSRPPRARLGAASASGTRSATHASDERELGEGGVQRKGVRRAVAVGVGVGWDVGGAVAGGARNGAAARREICASRSSLTASDAGRGGGACWGRPPARTVA